MRTIHKYILDHYYDNKISIPVDHLILSVGLQPAPPPNRGEQLVMWAMIDTDTVHKTITLVVYGTGNEIPENDNLLHIGTVQSKDEYVWHVFKKL